MIQQLLATIDQGLYDLVVLIILIPKTLAKIVVSPSWINSYVASQLRLPADEQFQTYTAPVLFFAVLVVLPATWLFRVLFTFYRDNWVLKAYAGLGLESQILCLAVFLASWPLGASMVIQVISRREVSRQSLRPAFYCQAYCFGALYFFMFVSMSSILAVIHSPPRWWSVPLLLSGGLYCYWYLYTEVRVIRAQLNTSTVRTLGVLVLMYFAGSLLTAVTELILLAGLKLGAFGNP